MMLTLPDHLSSLQFLFNIILIFHVVHFWPCHFYPVPKIALVQLIFSQLSKFSHLLTIVEAWYLGLFEINVNVYTTCTEWPDSNYLTIYLTHILWYTCTVEPVYVSVHRNSRTITTFEPVLCVFPREFWGHYYCQTWPLCLSMGILGPLLQSKHVLYVHPWEFWDHYQSGILLVQVNEINLYKQYIRCWNYLPCAVLFMFTCISK